MNWHKEMLVVVIVLAAGPCGFAGSTNRIQVPVGVVAWNQDVVEMIAIQSEEKPILRTGSGYGPVVDAMIRPMGSDQWRLEVTIDPHSFVGEKTADVPIEVQVGQVINRYEIILDFPPFKGNWCRQISLSEENPVQAWAIRSDGVKWVSAWLEKAGKDLTLEWTQGEGGTLKGQISFRGQNISGPRTPVVGMDKIILRDSDGNKDFIRVWVTRFRTSSSPASQK